MIDVVDRVGTWCPPKTAWQPGQLNIVEGPEVGRIWQSTEESRASLSKLTGIVGGNFRQQEKHYNRERIRDEFY